MRQPTRFIPLQFNRSRIARITSDRKTSAIVSIAVLIISTWLVTSCVNNDDSTQYLRVAGICNKQTSITLIDESDKSVEKDNSLNLYKARRKLFRQYAINVSQYLFAKVDKMGQCQGGWMNDPEVELVFVYRPLIGAAKFESLANFNNSKSSDTRILDSPWVKMRIDKSPKLVIRAVFFWNERQFFFDQAMMSGLQTGTNQPLVPLKLKVFISHYKDYVHLVMDVPERGKEEGKFSSSQQLENAITTARIEVSKRTPADIMWLLHDFKWTSGHQIIEEDLKPFFRQYNTQYIELTKSLLNARLDSVQTEQKYNNILDLKSIFNINNYKYIRR